MNTHITTCSASLSRFGKAVTLLTLLALSACDPGPASMPGASAASGAEPAPVQNAALIELQPAALFDEALRADLDGDVWLAQERFMALAVRFPETRHGRAARHRVSGGLGLPVLVGGAGVMAAVAIPAFTKYTRRSKTIEATMNLRILFDAAVISHAPFAEDGSPLAAPFPPSVGLTPNHTACVNGESVPHPVDHTLWAHPTWQALNFAVYAPSLYQYEFVSAGEGADATFTVRAVGDLDCDGVLSTFERSGYVTPDGIVSGGPGLFQANELE